MGQLSKGVAVMLTKRPDGFDAKVLSFIVIYAGVGLRDERLNQQLGEAMMKMPFPRLKRLRRDAHEPLTDCWLHAPRFCLSST